MAKIKKMCKIKEDKFKDLKSKIMKELREPKHVCKKCLRVSKNQDLLCKPETID